MTTEPKTKVYGTANPTLPEPSAGSRTATVPITASYATTARQFSDVGGYPITATLSGQPLVELHGGQHGQHAVHHAGRQTISWTTPGGHDLRDALSGAVGRERHGSCRRRVAGQLDLARLPAHLNAGTDTLTVTAAGTTDYSQATASVTLVVQQAH